MGGDEAGGPEDQSDADGHEADRRPPAGDPRLGQP
jgi:hypothetical protein